MADVTHILNAIEQGDTRAIDGDRLNKYDEPFRHYFEDI